MNWIAIFIGGGIGSLLRYFISKMVIKYGQETILLATVLSNLLSCLILAITIAFIMPKLSDNHWLKPFIIIGFCGGFSTFSTFSIETFQLLKDNNIILAGLNIAVSILLCLFVLWVVFKLKGA